MKVTHHAEVSQISGPSIRGKNNLRKTLLQGKNGTPTNFEISIKSYKNEGNGSPRHRHAFDQIRYALVGEIEYAPGRAIPEGCLAYFPEGTSYGPFKIDPKSSWLALQFGGPSGNGFVLGQDLKAAQQALAEEGTFEKGVYTYLDKDGKKHNEDAHLATWKRATGGKEVKMPAGRYNDPILIFPESYSWRNIGPSVSEKLLGMFNERRTYAKMLRIDSGGVYVREPGTQENIFFVVDGALSIDNEEVCQKHDAFHLEREERKKLSALKETTLLVYGLPEFN